MSCGVSVSHLQFPKCDKPLTLSLQGQSIQRNTSVKVSCLGAHPWSLYLTSTISIKKSVIAVRQELPRHHIVRKDDLVEVKQNVYNLRNGYITSPNLVIGKQLKRALRTGDVIYNYQLQAPDIIKKGDRVTVIAKRGSLAVISPGIALNDASEGERLRVENQRSSRIIHTRAIAPGTAEVL